MGSKVVVTGLFDFWACRHYKQCFNRAYLCFARLHQEIKKTKLDKEDAEVLEVLKTAFQRARAGVHAAKTIWAARKTLDSVHADLGITIREIEERVRSYMGLEEAS